MPLGFLKNLCEQVAINLLPKPTPIPLQPTPVATTKTTRKPHDKSIRATKGKGVLNHHTDKQDGFEATIVKETTQQLRFGGLSVADLDFLTENGKFKASIYADIKAQWALEKSATAINKHYRGKSGYSISNIKRYLSVINKLAGEGQHSPIEENTVGATIEQ